MSTTVPTHFDIFSTLGIAHTILYSTSFYTLFCPASRVWTRLVLSYVVSCMSSLSCSVLSKSKYLSNTFDGLTNVLNPPRAVLSLRQTGQVSWAPGYMWRAIEGVNAKKKEVPRTCLPRALARHNPPLNPPLGYIFVVKLFLSPTSRVRLGFLHFKEDILVFMTVFFYSKGMLSNAVCVYFGFLI